MQSHLHLSTAALLAISATLVAVLLPAGFYEVRASHAPFWLLVYLTIYISMLLMASGFCCRSLIDGESCDWAPYLLAVAYLTLYVADLLGLLFRQKLPPAFWAIEITGAITALPLLIYGLLLGLGKEQISGRLSVFVLVLMTLGGVALISFSSTLFT